MNIPNLRLDCIQLATLLLAITAFYSTTYAGNLPGVEPLTEHILLDDSNEQELIISNTETTATENDLLTLAADTKWQGKSQWKQKTVPYQAEVQAAAQATQLDPALIHAVIATESGYNPKALSRRGAYGLMQVLPATAQTMTSIPVKQWSVRQQILWGSHYLRRLLNMFEGNITLALAAYNAGPQAVKTYQHAVPPFTETRQYVPKVLGYYQTFKTRLSPTAD